MHKENPFFRRFSPHRNHSNRWRRWLGAALGLIALAFLIYNIPFVHDRLAWRISDLRSQITYFFNPPEEAIFIPEENQAAVASATAAALTPAATRTPLAITATPFPTEDPIPPSISLTGFKYIDQYGGWNLCGPATLAMALTYWGWEGTRSDVEDYVKPGLNDPNLDRVARGKPDKNVMPYEMEDFVDSQVPGLQAVVRVGGDIERVKRLIAAGFPVVVEKGYTERDASGKISWLGHYLFVTGYDDLQERFIVQDVYLKTGEDGTGKNLTSSYEEFINQWRSFNYLFLVIYPEERLEDVLRALGPFADEQWANERALEIAQTESTTLSGFDQYFAWFNVGSSHVRLFQYVDAAFAYDYAFQLYAGLPNDVAERPYRMMWYQTGPYWAYYYSGRYQDVIDLANYTLYETISEPTLEESLYWRGLARLALGETDNAIADLQESVRINPNFWAGWQQLEALGISG
ncbi:MAG: C39 family peptidase [Chloroflexi bacterium]|nr:C39 family peptidase [Chloroflexota bacterium]